MDKNTEFFPGTIKLEDLQSTTGRDQVILNPTSTDDPNDPLVGPGQCILTQEYSNTVTDTILLELVKMAEI